MGLPLLGPDRQARDAVDRLQQSTDEPVTVLMRTVAVHLGHQPTDRSLHVGDRPFGVALALQFQALRVLDELLAIEGGTGG